MPKVERLTGQPDIAAKRQRAGPEQALQQFGTARPQQPGEPHHLALSNLKADVPQPVLRRLINACQRQSLDFKQHRAGSPGGHGLAGDDVATDHQVGDLAGSGLGGGTGVDEPPVPQHGDGVGNPKHLIHLVRDVKHGDAAGLQRANQCHQPIGLSLRQRARGLVQDEHITLAGESPGDLDQLLVPDPQPPNQPLGIQLAAHLTQPVAGSLAHCAIPQPAPGDPQFPTEEQVRRDGQFLHQVQFLVDDRNPRRLGIAGGVKLRGGSPQLKLAGVSGLHTRKQLHEGAFARPVFPDDRMHRPGLDGQRDAIEGQDSREPHRHIPHLDHRGAGLGVPQPGPARPHPFRPRQTRIRHTRPRPWRT